MKFTKKIIQHEVSGIIEVDLDPFYDSRGQIWSVYQDSGLFPRFVEDKITISSRNVLRGFHGDSDTGKLITCLKGKMQLVVVDTRATSSLYGETREYLISDKNPKLVYVPPGFINAHLCLSKDCIFYYKWTKEYTGPEKQVTIRWDDPDIGANWRTDDPVLSQRDAQGTSFKFVKL